MKFLLIDGQGYTALISTKKISRFKTPLYPPLGLLYIGRALEDEGHEVEVIHYFDEDLSEKKFEKSLTSVDAVGLSVSTSSYKSSYKDMAQIAKTIKEIDSSIPLIIGGPHCTFHPKQSLKEIPSADISVEGEADLVIKDIAKSLEGNGKNLSEIDGVFYREKNEIKVGSPYKIIRDLDSIPFPARHLVDKYEYGMINNIYLFKPKLASMITSRGCPFHCRFCARHALTYKTFRQRSAENVVKEIQEIDDKYKTVCIVDDNFLVDKKRAYKIMDSLIEKGTNIELLVLGARVDSAERDLYKKMKKAGVKYLEFGIESGNQDVLDFYNKKITLDQVRKAVNLSSEMNFVTTGDFILGAPIETERHIEQTIKFACSLPLDIAVFFPLGYMYGSDLWNEAVENGIINKDDGYSFLAGSRIGLGNFTTEELQEFCKKAMKRFYLRPNYIVSQFIRSVKRKNFSLIRSELGNL